jgi:hypothetical protein
MRVTLGRANLGFFAAVALVVSACASLRPYDPGPGKRVAVAFAQDAFVSGQSVNVTIANLSEVTLFYPGGFCKTELQKKSGSSWLTVSAHALACPIERDFLEPGQTVVHQFRLPTEVADGTYRLTMPMPTTLPEEAAVTEPAPEPALKTPAFRVQAALESLPKAHAVAEQ